MSSSFWLIKSSHSSGMAIILIHLYIITCCYMHEQACHNAYDSNLKCLNFGFIIWLSIVLNYYNLHP